MKTKPMGTRKEIAVVIRNQVRGRLSCVETEFALNDVALDRDVLLS